MDHDVECVLRLCSNDTGTMIGTCDDFPDFMVSASSSDEIFIKAPRALENAFWADGKRLVAMDVCKTDDSNIRVRFTDRSRL